MVRFPILRIAGSTNGAAWTEWEIDWREPLRAFMEWSSCGMDDGWLTRCGISWAAFARTFWTWLWGYCAYVGGSDGGCGGCGGAGAEALTLISAIICPSTVYEGRRWPELGKNTVKGEYVCRDYKRFVNIPSWRVKVAVCWSTPLTTPSKTAPGGFRSVTATESPTKPVAMVANGTHEAVPKFCLGWLLNEAELRKAQRSSTDAFQ